MVTAFKAITFFVPNDTVLVTQFTVLRPSLQAHLTLNPQMNSILKRRPPIMNRSTPPEREHIRKQSRVLFGKGPDTSDTDGDDPVNEDCDQAAAPSGKDANQERAAGRQGVRRWRPDETSSRRNRYGTIRRQDRSFQPDTSSGPSIRGAPELARPTAEPQQEFRRYTNRTRARLATPIIHHQASFGIASQTQSPSELELEAQPEILRHRPMQPLPRSRLINRTNRPRPTMLEGNCRLLQEYIPYTSLACTLICI